MAAINTYTVQKRNNKTINKAGSERKQTEL